MCKLSSSYRGSFVFSFVKVSGKVGVVGDRSIIFKTKGGTGKPTIEIVKEKTLMRMTIPSGTSTHVSDVITYVD